MRFWEQERRREVEKTKERREETLENFEMVELQADNHNWGNYFLNNCTTTSTTLKVVHARFFREEGVAFIANRTNWVWHNFQGARIAFIVDRT